MKGRISASEINKFTRCPYSYYYEKLYGVKALREAHAERMRKLGYTDTSKSAFVRGVKYHRRHYALHTLRRAALWTAVFLFFVCAGALVWKLLA